MAEIQIPNVRQESTILFHTKLNDNLVQVNWDSLSNIKAYMYSDAQKVIAGKCDVVIASRFTLDVTYPATRPQYLGVNSLLIRCTYQGRQKTFDLPVVNFVERSAEADGVTVLDDPEMDVTLEVDEVSTSLLDGAIAAALDAAVEAEDAAQEARDAAQEARDAIADLPEVVTSLSSQSTDAEVPSAKTVYEAIQAGGGGGASNVFIAIFGETDFTEISAAILADKAVFCLFTGAILPLWAYSFDFDGNPTSATFQQLSWESVEVRIRKLAVDVNAQGWTDNTETYDILTREGGQLDADANLSFINTGDTQVASLRYDTLTIGDRNLSAASGARASYMKDCIEARIRNGRYILRFPEKAGTFALLSDIPDANVYVADRDDTTFADIVTAREDGKAVLLYVYEGIDDEGFFTLANITDTTFTFAAVKNINGVPRAVFYTIDNNDEWSTVSMDLAKVSDIPTVPTDVVKYSSQSLTEQQKAQARTNIGAGTYSKANTGIPKADLASSVQDSLDAADSAYQKPNTGIPASDLAPGVIPTVPTDVVKYTSQSLSDAQKAQARTNIGAGTSSFSGSYADLTNKPTIPTVPAISTDIAADKTSNAKTASPAAVYNEVHPGIVTSQPSGGFAPNILYNLGELTGAVTFALAAEVSGIVNHYYWTFDTGATEPTITWPAGITSWVGGSAPTIGASKHYEISVLGGVGAYMEV